MIQRPKISRDIQHTSCKTLTALTNTRNPIDCYSQICHRRSLSYFTSHRLDLAARFSEAASIAPRERAQLFCCTADAMCTAGTPPRRRVVAGGETSLPSSEASRHAHPGRLSVTHGRTRVRLAARAPDSASAAIKTHCGGFSRAGWTRVVAVNGWSDSARQLQLRQQWKWCHKSTRSQTGVLVS